MTYNSIFTSLLLFCYCFVIIVILVKIHVKQYKAYYSYICKVNMLLLTIILISFVFMNMVYFVVLIN